MVGSVGGWIECIARCLGPWGGWGWNPGPSLRWLAALHRLAGALVTRRALVALLDRVVRVASGEDPYSREGLPPYLGGPGPGIVPSSTSPPPRRARQKLGRNDPCPCGSGRKVKRCCGTQPWKGGPRAHADAAGPPSLKDFLGRELLLEGWLEREAPSRASDLLERCARDLGVDPADVAERGPWMGLALFHAAAPGSGTLAAGLLTEAGSALPPELAEWLRAAGRGRFSLWVAEDDLGGGTRDLQDALGGETVRVLDEEGFLDLKRGWGLLGRVSPWGHAHALHMAHGLAHSGSVLESRVRAAAALLAAADRESRTERLRHPEALVDLFHLWREGFA